MIVIILNCDFMKTLKNDIKLYYKLQELENYEKVRYAYYFCMDLNINSKILYSKYQIINKYLNDVSFEDVLSFSKLLDSNYFHMIEKLCNEIKSNDKIITFPKIN